MAVASLENLLLDELSERLKKANHDGQTPGTVVLALLERLVAPDAPPKNLGKPAPKRRRTRATG